MNLSQVASRRSFLAALIATAAAILPAQSALAQARGSYSVTSVYGVYGAYTNYQRITVKGVATGNVFNLYYASAIDAKVGDMLTVLFDSNNNWKTVINERNGRSSIIVSKESA
jgi:hypothetical protein